MPIHINNVPVHWGCSTVCNSSNSRSRYPLSQCMRLGCIFVVFHFKLCPDVPAIRKMQYHRILCLLLVCCLLIRCHHITACSCVVPAPSMGNHNSVVSDGQLERTSGTDETFRRRLLPSEVTSLTFGIPLVLLTFGILSARKSNLTKPQRRVHVCKLRKAWHACRDQPGSIKAIVLLVQPHDQPAHSGQARCFMTCSTSALKPLC